MKKRDSYQEKHPAFGQALFARVTGGIGKLYGSALPDHHTAVKLTIGRSVLQHDLGRDWHFTPLNDQLIEVEFSAAQFAELLTSMNVGSGVCCTIRHVGLEAMPRLPKDHEVEHERVKADFEQSIAGLVKELRDAEKEVEQLLEEKTVKTAARERIKAVLARAIMEVAQNAPFMVDQFQEAAVKTVTAAKAEMDAAVTTMVTKLGIEQLQARGLGGAGGVLQLGQDDKERP